MSEPWPILSPPAIPCPVVAGAAAAAAAATNNSQQQRPTAETPNADAQQL